MNVQGTESWATYFIGLYAVTEKNKTEKTKQKTSTLLQMKSSTLLKERIKGCFLNKCIASSQLNFWDIDVISQIAEGVVSRYLDPTEIAQVVHLPHGKTVNEIPGDKQMF